MTKITHIRGRQILDSRGMPTIEVDTFLASGARGRASVPSGASTGSHEAVELRDNDPAFFNGKGVLRALHKIHNEIAPLLIGKEAENQLEIDTAMRMLDGTENKSNLGANTMLAVSLSVAKASSISNKIPLYKYLGGMNARVLPVPMMNILNGGKHADNSLDIQEFMIMPVGANSFADALRMGSEVFWALKSILKQAGMNTSVGDEGGFAPKVNSAQEALDFLSQAVEKAGYQLGSEIVFALDVASSELYHEGMYDFVGEGKRRGREELVKYYEELSVDYPLFSIEDGMAEDDWEGWQMLSSKLGDKLQLVGDDLFTTNIKRIGYGIEQGIANAVLIKPNQIGTLTETREAINMAFENGYRAIVSHRSGETEDTTIADIAVGMNTGQIKAGSLSRTERMAKYNRLLRIEEELGKEACFGCSKKVLQISKNK